MEHGLKSHNSDKLHWLSLGLVVIIVTGHTCYFSKGVYPQSDGGLAIVDIDASKGFFDLWVHFLLSTEHFNQNSYGLKVQFLGFD